MSLQLEIDDDKVAMYLAIHAKIKDVYINKQNLDLTSLEWILLDDLVRVMRGENLDGYEGIRRIEQPEWTEKIL